MGGVFGLVNTEQEVLGHEKAVMATVSDGQIVATLKVLSTCYYTQRSQGACMFCRVARCSFLGRQGQIQHRYLDPSSSLTSLANTHCLLYVAKPSSLTLHTYNV